MKVLPRKKKTVATFLKLFCEDEKKNGCDAQKINISYTLW